MLIEVQEASLSVAHMRHVENDYSQFILPTRCNQFAPTRITSYCDGRVVNNVNHNFSLASAGIWAEPESVDDSIANNSHTFAHNDSIVSNNSGHFISQFVAV